MRIVYSDEVWAALKRKYETTPGIEWTELVNLVRNELKQAVPSSSVVRRRALSESWVGPLKKRARAAVKITTAKLHHDIKKIKKNKRLKSDDDINDTVNDSVTLNESIKNVTASVIDNKKYQNDSHDDNDLILNDRQKKSFDQEVKSVVVRHRKNNRDMCRIHEIGKEIVLSAAADYLLECAAAGAIVADFSMSEDSIPPEVNDDRLDQIKRRMNMGNALISLSKTGFESIKMALDIDKELYGLTPDAFIDRSELEATTKAKMGALDEMLEAQKKNMLSQQIHAFQRDLVAMEQEALMPSLTYAQSDNDDDDDDNDESAE